MLLPTYLLLHVSVPLLLSLPNGSGRAQDGHLVQLEELLTQAVLQVLVQLTAGEKHGGNVTSPKNNQAKLVHTDGFHFLPIKMLNLAQKPNLSNDLLFAVNMKNTS